MANNPSTEFVQTILNLQEQYYSANQKNRFMKKQQKLDCANSISQSIGILDLLNQSITSFDGYKIYVDYTVLKTFVCPANYTIVVDHFINIITSILNCNGRFHLHVNLNSLTISALDRYKELIMLISKRCSDNQFDQYLDIFNIHNSPSFLTSTSNLLAPFMPDTVKNKIQFIHKNDTNKLPDLISKKIN